MTEQEIRDISKFRELHRSVEELERESGKRSVPSAVECGRILSERKKECGHGKWLIWRKVNLVEVSERTINRYMRLYESVTNDGFDVTGLSLTECYIKLGFLKDGKLSKRVKSVEDKTKEEAPSNDKEEEETPMERLQDLVTEIVGVVSQIEPSEKLNILKVIHPIVFYYNEQIEMKAAA